mmetsp:Transcript_31297/g.89816  ORF Transcript_31297/g.89816 Transcript_31297/m.89816 type:complete len:207 (+) Transcript_31297:304-924(+)
MLAVQNDPWHIFARGIKADVGLDDGKHLLIGRGRLNAVTNGLWLDGELLHAPIGGLLRHRLWLCGHAEVERHVLIRIYEHFLRAHVDQVAETLGLAMLAKVDVTVVRLLRVPEEIPLAHACHGNGLEVSCWVQVKVDKRSNFIILPEEAQGLVEELVAVWAHRLIENVQVHATRLPVDSLPVHDGSLTLDPPGTGKEAGHSGRQQC